MTLHPEKSGRSFCTALFLAAAVACAGNQLAAQTVINLGTAESFAVLGGASVVNTGNTVLFGDLGVSPGATISGFTPGIVVGGSIYINDTVAIQAHNDATTAYDQLVGLTPTDDLTGQDLGGLTLTPGVYFYSAAAGLTGTLTLDGLNQADTLFVFQIGSTLTTGVSAFNLINGATADNVWFQVGSSSTLGAGTAFEGTIIAHDSDNLITGVSVLGRVIALNATVTLDTNTITAIPEPGVTVLIFSALVTLAVIGRRYSRFFIKASAIPRGSHTP
ncbi:MAG TPA: ice-binding family protein [Rariglobus sp.]|nr:ice-binding family protein [Rariglobus sp.]